MSSNPKHNPPTQGTGSAPPKPSGRPTTAAPVRRVAGKVTRPVGSGVARRPHAAAPVPPPADLPPLPSLPDQEEIKVDEPIVDTPVVNPTPAPDGRLGMESIVLPEGFDGENGLVLNYMFTKPTRFEPDKYLKLDIEAYRLRAPALAEAALPRKVSLRAHVPSVYNQGTIGSCVAHSAAQAIKIVMGKAHSNRYFATRFFTSSGVYNPSRLYIYYNARLELGEDVTKDIGATNYGGIKALEEFKAPDEALWPYEKSRVGRKPSHEAYADAHRYKVFEYFGVGQDLHSLRDALAGGAPIMIGVQLAPSFVNCGRDGLIQLPDLDRERIIGGHSILLVGYDDDKRHFIFVNHWSATWGDQGFGYIPYEYVLDNDLCGDFYAIQTYA